MCRCGSEGSELAPLPLPGPQAPGCLAARTPLGAPALAEPGHRLFPPRPQPPWDSRCASAQPPVAVREKPGSGEDESRARGLFWELQSCPTPNTWATAGTLPGLGILGWTRQGPLGKGRMAPGGGLFRPNTWHWSSPASGTNWGWGKEMQSSVPPPAGLLDGDKQALPWAPSLGQEPCPPLGSTFQAPPPPRAPFSPWPRPGSLMQGLPGCPALPCRVPGGSPQLRSPWNVNKRRTLLGTQGARCGGRRGQGTRLLAGAGFCVLEFLPGERRSTRPVWVRALREAERGMLFCFCFVLKRWTART